jgi:hypothetical protein
MDDDSPKFYIYGPIGTSPTEITAEEYSEAKFAKQGLLLLLSAEEKFDMLMQNYVEYECELLGLAQAQMAWRGVRWDSMSDERTLLNRRLANLLTVARLYRDQTERDIKHICDETSDTSYQFQQELRTQYDALLGFRVMEAVRNALQHRFLPITGLSYPGGWESRSSGDVLVHRARAWLVLEHVRADGGFKGSVLQELESKHEDKFDVTLFVREYVQGLSCAHRALRALTDAAADRWKGVIGCLFQRGRDFGATPSGSSSQDATMARPRQKRFRYSRSSSSASTVSEPGSRRRG